MRDCNQLICPSRLLYCVCRSEVQVMLSWSCLLNTISLSSSTLVSWSTWMCAFFWSFLSIHLTRCPTNSMSSVSSDPTLKSLRSDSDTLRVNSGVPVKKASSTWMATIPSTFLFLAGEPVMGSKRCSSTRSRSSCRRAGIVFCEL